MQAVWLQTCCSTALCLCCLILEKKSVVTLRYHLLSRVLLEKNTSNHIDLAPKIFGEGFTTVHFSIHPHHPSILRELWSICGSQELERKLAKGPRMSSFSELEMRFKWPGWHVWSHVTETGYRGPDATMKLDQNGVWGVRCWVCHVREGYQGLFWELKAVLKGYRLS